MRRPILAANDGRVGSFFSEAREASGDDVAPTVVWHRGSAFDLFGAALSAVESAAMVE